MLLYPFPMPRSGKRIRGELAKSKRAIFESYGTARAWDARRRGRRRIAVPGVTVVSVNWNTLEFLRVFVAAVSHRTPGAHILIVDNASSDGSREFLKNHSAVTSILLPVNVRHGRALDIGVGHVATDTVVVLDIDAFPVHDQWLDASLSALNEGGA